MSSALQATSAAVRTGSFKYLVPSVEHSLYRNGKVLTRRDRDGSDAEWKGVDLEPRDMQVTDARGLPDGKQRTLLQNGFELRRQRLTDPTLDFLNHDAVIASYYPQCAELVCEASGASFAAAFDHNVRSASARATSAGSRAASRCKARRMSCTATTRSPARRSACAT